MRPPGSHPAGLFQRNLHPPHNMMDGVSTYLALIFGTLLSSQGTDTSFVLTLSGFPPGVSFRSCVSDSIRPFPVPISSAAFQVSAFAFPFPAIPTLSESQSRDFRPSRSASEHVSVSGSRPGGAVNVLERGSPMQIGEPRSRRTRAGVRPRPRPAGSSAGDGRCPRPTCPVCGG